MRDTVSIDNFGQSLGIKFNIVILEKLGLNYQDNVKITIVGVVKGNADLLKNSKEIIFYGRVIKSGNALGFTIKKRDREVMGIEEGHVFNVEIEKIPT